MYILSGETTLSKNKVHFKTIEFAPRGDQPQSRNTSLPEQQQKKRWGTNKGKTDATYETTDGHTKKIGNIGSASERSLGKLLKATKVSLPITTKRMKSPS